MVTRLSIGKPRNEVSYREKRSENIIAVLQSRIRDIPDYFERNRESD